MAIHTRILVLGCVAGLGALTSVGCGDQVDSSYPGELVATLKGVANVTGSPPTSDAFVHLLWYRTVGGSDTTVADRAHLQRDGSAIGFTFTFYSAPERGAFNDYTEGGKHPSEGRVALGYLAAMKSGFDARKQEDGGEKEPWDDSHIAGLLLGIATKHVLVYVEKDVQANTFQHYLLNGTLKAGYHLMEVHPLTDNQRQKILACQAAAANDAAIRACGALADSLVEAPAGMSTLIPIEIPGDPTTLRWPRWVEPRHYRDTL